MKALYHQCMSAIFAIASLFAMYLGFELAGLFDQLWLIPVPTILCMALAFGHAVLAEGST